MYVMRPSWLMPFLAVIAIIAAVLFAVQDVRAGKAQVFTGLVPGVAVGGYDPVAYFTDGKPRKGRENFTFEYNGAKWRFASAENRDSFEANPTKYAPQYGGYCAWAVSRGYTAKGDPNAWKIVDDKLYLNYNRSVQTTWAKDIPGNIAKGDANWPTVLNK